MCGTFQATHTSICLSTKWLCVEIHKHEPKGRFFADKTMLQHAGGPWFIRQFKLFLEPQLHKMQSLHMIVKIGDIEATDLFGYHNCNMILDFNHNTRSNPIALQIVQKARLFAIVDEELERLISQHR